MNSLILIILFLLLIFIFLIIKSKKGLFRIVNRDKINYEKIQVEDALKHIYDCEFRKTDCTSSSLSGNLSISNEKSSELVNSLLGKKLINLVGNKINLTDEGKKYALQVIRIHRLWEKFLAENTSVTENDWHSIAEKKEHETTFDDANKIAAQLGNPLVDPHGDPIPNENGEMIFEEGIPLDQIESGSFVKVVHVEDEPKEIFAKIISLGILPNAKIFVEEKTDEKIKIRINDKEQDIKRVYASNINVINVEDEIEKEKVVPLSSLKIDEPAVVAFLSHGLRGQQRRRLLDFGIVPNTEIIARMKSLNDDPTAYEVRRTLIALRKNQSDLIFVKKKVS